METPAVPLLAEKQQGYNNCFCLAQQDKSDIFCCVHRM